MKRLGNRPVPVILQLNALECGAACLAMVLSYYGRKTSVAECRVYCDAGRDGLTAQTIANAARRYGLRVRAFVLQEPSELHHIQRPAIVHWRFNHFVVVESWSPQQVTVVDPAAGRRRLSATEFQAGFTGVVLTFAPGDDFERRSAVRLGWLAPMRQLLATPGIGRLLGQIFGASLLLQITGLALPLCTKVLIDQLLPQATHNLILALGVGMLFIILAQVATHYLRATLLTYLRARLDAQMMLGFLAHVLALPFGFFQARTSGDLLMRLSSNVAIRETLTGQLLSTFLDGALVLTYLAILLTQDLAISLVAVATGILQVALLLGAAHRVHDLMQQDLAAQAASQSYLVEALRGILTLKACGAEERALEHWSHLFFAHLGVSQQRSHLTNRIDAAMLALRSLAPFLLLWIGAARVMAGEMSLGAMLALNAVAMAFLAPLTSLATQSQELQRVSAHFDRLADVLDAEPEQRAVRLGMPPRLAGQIELQRVSFRYHPQAPWVFQDISVTIKPGQKIALVGRTGSGKSTLAMLLLGLYRPVEGRVLYDGIPLEHLELRTLRQQMGVVLQEPFLFSGSIRQNITLHAPHLGLDQVVAAAQGAAIHTDIVQMPMGYETLIAEGGAGLSGGQRQRLALARALAHQPALLLLDEATSHLDVVTERTVDGNLSQLSCTRVVIAHRLSTICNADQIWVLDQGRIVERGTHEQLLQQGGVYTSLIHSQFGVALPS
jgi:ABC-type bacteriocin/lantibiotic exporter with double-glycine peptidase domain